MYADYFGLRELPFSIAPNPRFLYMSNAHQEALAHLLYGLDQTGGFIVLTGEVGTGKTTLSRRALENAPKKVRIAFIITPNLAPAQLLETICDELEIGYEEGESIRKLTDRIQRDLIKNHGEGKHTVLIIDEAQNMRRETLEQVRMLTNLETDEEKLLRIILIGQPELTNILRQDNMRQLRQRITGAYHLTQLNENDTRSYIESRLNTAGASRPVFTAGAFKTIYRLSKGIPRLINVICDRAMLGAFSHNENLVSKKYVQNAFDELSSLDTNKKRINFALIWSCLAVLLVSVGAYFGYRYYEGRPQTLAIQNNSAIAATPIVINDSISDSDIISLGDAFTVLTSLVLEKPAANCNDLSKTPYHCSAFKAVSVDELAKIQPPYLVELNDGKRFQYWVLRDFDEQHVTLDNGSARFNIAENRFASEWTGSFLILARN